jgi:hypothetical protein
MDGAISSPARSISPEGISSIAPCMNIAMLRSDITDRNGHVETREVETLIDLRETRPMPTSTLLLIRSELLTVSGSARMTIARDILALTAAQPTKAC